MTYIHSNSKVLGLRLSLLMLGVDDCIISGVDDCIFSSVDFVCVGSLCVKC